MKIETTKLETLVRGMIKATNKKEGEPAGETILQDKNLFEEETQRVKQAMHNKVMGISKEKKVIRYVRQHQYAVTRMCNNIAGLIPIERFNDFDGPASSVEAFNLLSFAFHRLENLLSYMENTFANYFDLDSPVPEGFQILNKFESLNILHQLGSTPVCSLKETALHPVRGYTLGNALEPYRRVYYYNGLLKQVKGNCLGCRGETPNCKLWESLVYNNFNSIRFYSHQTDRLKKEVNGNYKGNGDKIAVLSLEHKKLNQVPENRAIAYDYGQPSIKEQLDKWFREEIQYIKSLPPEHDSRVIGPQVPVPGDFKLETGMSVPQAAYFVRILSDCGILSSKNPKELITFFSHFLRTKNKEEISPGNFKNKYYEATDGTREHVRQEIIKLLNRTKDPG